MKKNYFKSFKWTRFMSVFTMLTAFAINANAFNTNTYYYKATANASPTGAGKVYVSQGPASTVDFKLNTHSITGSMRNIAAPTADFYFYATANEGYMFDHWAQSENGTSVSISNPYTVSREISSTNENRPTQITYYAVFKKQTGLVKVYTEDAARGSATINNSENGIGDNVVLTATPDAANGVRFLGWKKGSLDEEEYISTDNPYSFEVTAESEGNYYACFSPAIETTYCRIRNIKTGRYLSVYGDTKAAPHKTTVTSQGQQREVTDGYIFTNGLKMISADEAQGNPATVFKRTGWPGMGATTHVNLAAHGMSLVDDLTDQEHYLLMDYDDDNSLISTSIDLGSGVGVTSYLMDEGTDWAIMRSYRQNEDWNDATEWEVILLHEDQTDYAFGANTKAKFTKDGKYYTTMYTDFAYQLLDGVKAYYLAADETSYQEGSNTVVLTEITSGIVPENTAVILECTDVQNDASAAEVKNRLLPLKDPVNEPLHNILKGYISLNGSKVANNHDKMYVFSMNGENKLGFYHSTSANMTPNKAYLDVSDVQESIDDNPAIKNVRISFGDPDNEETTIITLTQLDEANTSAIYDLSGRKVSDDASQMNDLRKGIYIANGKKYIVK